MKYPARKYFYADEVYDIPADGWSEEDVGSPEEEIVPYMLTLLTCSECSLAGTKDCPHHSHGAFHSAWPACMAFEERV